jgi:D-lyxose ketol-isomerase
MKRSQINARMRAAVAFFDEHQFWLPPYVYWSPADWRAKGPEADEIRRCGMGWDLTDFGLGDFDNVGLLLLTLRNGVLGDERATRPYAEKAMIVGVGQVTPWHYHGSKQEDIINRGGGDLVIELCNSHPSLKLLDTEVSVSVDGSRRLVRARGSVVLTPGESITLYQGLAHTFHAERAPTLVGEVSSVNDDRADNYFIERAGRFPAIEEDEEPLYLLCNEYPGTG